MSTRPEIALADLHLLHQANGILLLDLHAITDRIANARAYLRRPDADPFRGHADLTALHIKRQGLHVQLRANRRMIDDSDLGETWS